MADTLTGLVLGDTIKLDAAVPPLEGRRVRVILELLDEAEAQLPAAAQAQIWQEWAEHGPQGPIEDEDEPAFP